MKIGDSVTMLIPLLTDNKKFSAKRGTYLGWHNGNRIVFSQTGLRWEIPRGSPARLTTKPVNISPCGLKE